MKQTLSVISGIELVEVTGDNPEVGVILLHGYGANMQDLLPLWKLWHKDNYSWYFPNGVMSLPMGHYEGRAWFSIDIQKFEESMRTGKARDLREMIPQEFNATLSQLENLVKEISKRHKKLIIGGFSQGAMCAVHLGMKSELKIDGLILLSGALIAVPKMSSPTVGLPFYQSHGTGDPVLSYEGAKALEKYLHDLNFTGSLHAFQGGHEIPTSVIQGVGTFLSQALKGV